ncbi:MAG: hypothetical protein WC724_03815 [Candidatus Paceibacterota bacterium]|jgi:hypothetical protein
MEEEKKDLSPSQDTQEIEETQTSEETLEEKVARLEAEREADKAKREKAEKKATDQEIRAKIAEDKLKNKPQAKEGELSQTDVFVLTKAGVEIEDLDTIKMLSKSYGISIQEAIKNDEIKEVLRIRKEKRSTAQATFTGKSGNSSGKVSDQTILDKFSKGEIPAPGSSEAERLWKLRRGVK